MNLNWGIFFAFMGAANLWVAYKFPTDTWVNFKLYGSIVLMLAFVALQSLMLAKYFDKEESK
jgi:intracellular septation protein